MPYLEATEDGHITAFTEWSDRELIRQVPGMRWDPVGKVWVGPLSWAVCLAARGVFGAKLQIGPNLQAWAWEERKNRIEPCLALRNCLEQIADDRLYAFQRPGVEFLMKSMLALLADEMGTGKTVQAVEAARRLHAMGEQVFPIVVVAPRSVKISWVKHFNEWFPEAETFLIGGSAAKRKKMFDEAGKSDRAVVVINWESVRLHSRLAPFGAVRLKRCLEHGGDDPAVKVQACEVHPKELNSLEARTVIVDECHRMKDAKSKQTRATWAVQHGAHVRYRWSLTGTPVANDPGDLWAIMHGIAPHEYPTKTKFTDRYCLLSWNAFGAMDVIGVRPDTRDEFFALLDPRMRRMIKDIVLPFLPPKVRAQRYAEMDAKQENAYKQLEAGMVTRLDDGSVILATNNLTQNLRLLQFSSSYAEVDSEGHVKLADPSSKLDALEDILEELGNKSVVVCAESAQLINLARARLDKAGVSYRTVIGGQTDKEREQQLEDFQAGRARVMLFTIKAGGVGLTMTKSDTIVFLQRSWSMLENKQAEDRVHRIGSEVHESIEIIDIIAPGTVEESQIARLYIKMARLEEIVRDKAQLAAAGRHAEVAALEAEESAILSQDLTGVDTLETV